jgi:Cupin domain
MAVGKSKRRQFGALMLSSVVALGGVSAISSTAKTEDDISRFTYVRLHCTGDNQSHFTDVTIELTKENFAPPAAPIAIGGNRPTAKAFIAGFGAHWGAADLQTHLNHPTPAIQLFTVLRGEFSITATDGETRQLHAGDLVLLEDITPCRGHITVVGDNPGFLLFAR